MDIKALDGVERVRLMRIALFSGNYNYTLDGANLSLNRLVGHLQDRLGATVRVYSPTSPTPAFPAVGDLVSVPSVKIPFRTDYRIALGLPTAIRQDIEAFKPDLIHLSAPDPLGRAALKLGRRLKVPVVASLHTLFDTYLDYYGLGFLRPMARRQLWEFYGACDDVMAPNDALADELRVHVRSTLVHVWARGVDSALFSPGRRDEAWRARVGFDPDRPVIVFLGRIVLEKGLAAFADTIGRLEKAGHAPQVLVIGDGPARAWFAARLPRAVFTGFLTGEALSTALASGDIFLNPSTTETFGNVNLEAMASGLAMVCADALNTRALLRHEHNALLCAPDHPGSYAEALSKLLADDGARRRLGAQALKRSAAYRWSEILDEVARVYVEARDRHLASSALFDTSIAKGPLVHAERSGRAEPRPAALPAL